MELTLEDLTAGEGHPNVDLSRHHLQRSLSMEPQTGPAVYQRKPYMVTTTLLPDGRKVGLSFTHPSRKVNHPHKQDSLGNPLRVTQRASICDLYEEHDGGTWRPIGTGSVTLHYKDRFCYETGRKRSLTAALRDSKLDRTAREAIWTTYLNRK